MSYYEFKENLSNCDNKNSLIDQISLLNDEEILEILIGLQSDQYSDFLFFKEFKDRIVYNKDSLSKRDFSIFNILYCMDMSKIKSSFSYIINEMDNYHKVIKILLSGAIRFHPQQVFYLVNNSKFNNFQDVLLLKKFFLARGYPFFEIDKLLNLKERVDDKSSLSIQTHRRLKVALLISGQVRGIESALQSWQKVFNFENIELDVFLSTWGHSYWPDKLVWNRVAPPTLSNKIKDLTLGKSDNDILSLLSNFLPPRLLEKSYLNLLISEYLPVRKIDIDLECEEKFSEYTNPMKLYYKINRVFEMAKMSDNYDLYIRIRPDIHLTTDKTIDLVEINKILSKNRVMFTHYSYVFEFYGFGVDDKIAIGKYDCMKIYSDTWLMEQNGMRNRMQGHINLANNLMDHNISCKAIDGLNISFVNYNILNEQQIKNFIDKDSG